MKVALVALAFVALITLAAGQALDTTRYRRQEVDPVNLAAEIDALLSSVSDASSTLSNVRELIPDRATKGAVESLSNQVAALRETAGNRVFDSEVAGLSNLIALVTDTADTVESIGTQALSMVPGIESNAMDAVSLATETFTERVRQAGLVNRVDGALFSNLAPAITTASTVGENFNRFAENTVFADLSAKEAALRDTVDIATFVQHFGGMKYLNSQLPVMRWAQWSTYNQNNGWYFGNRNDLTGGVAPSSWGNGNARAYQMTTNVDYMRTLYNKRVYCGWNCAVHNNEWYSYSSTNSMHGSVLIRVRNTTPNAIGWPISFYYTGYSGWEEYASMSLNNAEVFSTGSNCGRCLRQQTLSMPGNRISTVIIVVSSSAQSGTRTMHLGFSGDSLQLPKGLEYVDDLDWISSL